MTDIKLEMMSKIYRETFINHLTYQWGRNYERQQADGCLPTLTPVLKCIYKDAPVEAKERAIRGHLEFFNTHATLVPLLFSLIATFEVNMLEDEKDSITSIKTGLMSPIVGLGDGLFWFTLRLICASVGAIIAVTGNVFGATFILVVFNILNQRMRWFGSRIGYTKDTEIINSSSGDEVIKRISGVATVLGLRIAGCLVSTTVKVNTSLVFVSGEGKIVVQELIDKITLCFLPVLVTTFCYWRLKKTNGKEAVLSIFGVMTVSIGLTYLGILGQNLQEASAHHDHDIAPLRLRSILKRGFVSEPQVWTIK